MAIKRRETEIAKSVVDWLIVQHCDVYQEVCLWTHGPVADIVAVFKHLVWVVECKTTLNLALIEQAQPWKRYAHFVSVAVPKVSTDAGREMARKVLQWLGIGLLVINVDMRSVYQQMSPALNRGAITARLKARLCEEQKTFAEAGNNNGQYWTPYQETCRRVIEKVTSSPGITFRELVEDLRHHYCSDARARSALRGWIDRGAIAGVRMEREGRLLRLYPVEGAR